MSRESILKTAEAEDGYKEQPTNMTKYGKWYGNDGVAWCAMFVSWVFAKAGHPLTNVETKYGFHYCPNGYAYWKKEGCFTNNPMPGDIVLYDLHEGGQISDHTGIFVKWIEQDKYFYAWEGNTNAKGQKNGDCVRLQERSIKQVKAFVNPKV